MMDIAQRKRAGSDRGVWPSGRREPLQPMRPLRDVVRHEHEWLTCSPDDACEDRMRPTCMTRDDVKWLAPQQSCKLFARAPDCPGAAEFHLAQHKGRSARRIKFLGASTAEAKSERGLLLR